MMCDGTANKHLASPLEHGNTRRYGRRHFLVLHPFADCHAELF